MKILLYFGHPSQYLFLRESIRILSADHKIFILIKTKDVLEDLIKNDGLPYKNILPRERGRSKVSIILSLIRRNIKILPIILKNRPQLLISTDASLAQLGWLLRINRITITEDDYNVIRHLAKLSYPFTDTILCPEACDVGKYTQKKVGYKGYMKLAYLHPNIFKIDSQVKRKYNLSDKFVLIRLSRLSAHHDFGIKGIDGSMLDSIIALVESKGFKIFISAEGSLGKPYQSYLLDIDPSHMQQVLAHASLLISDSQSMSVEAAMLGVPSIRYSSFAGKISVLEELEHKYKLTYGIPTGKGSLLKEKLNSILETTDLAAVFQQQRSIMLNDKIDVSAFLVWFISNYPDSKKIMHNNPDFQDKFR